MAKKKQGASGDVVSIPREQYGAMVDTMLELAFRGPQQEAIIMRAANAGGITQVTAEIKRRRMYAKKQGMVRATAQPDSDEPKPRHAKKRARKKATHTPPPPPPATEDEGASADTM